MENHLLSYLTELQKNTKNIYLGIFDFRIRQFDSKSLLQKIVPNSLKRNFTLCKK